MYREESNAEVFHNRCVWTIIWMSPDISTVETAHHFQKVGHCIWNGEEHAMSLGETTPLVMAWSFGSHGGQSDAHACKQLLFGELEKKRPSHSIKRRWRDVVAANNKAVGIEDCCNLCVLSYYDMVITIAIRISCNSIWLDNKNNRTVI